ncbi:MAG: GIY-YIG nuclease family protein [Deltaproteobacteria bacterium]
MSTGKVKDKVKALPDSPGVYLFKNAKGEIIYIGKAKSLKKRVSSYFGRFLNSKTQAMVSQVEDLEYILSPTEFQAQLWEASLIKEKQPRYNISLKDDKSFPMIRITGDDFPVVMVCRKQKGELHTKDGSTYYGPYTSANLLRQALKVIRRIFGFRSCNVMPRQPCLYFRLKLCPGPCKGKLTKQRYAEIIKDIQLVLDSRYDELAFRLSEKMNLAAKERRFEDAAKIRDQIHALSAVSRGNEFLNLNGIEELRKIAGMDRPPIRIEAFDIANISGKEATGSMVSFLKGSPDKDNYRRFRIKTVDRIDDYAMIREVVRRRYYRLKVENRQMPDLILIDGGRQHLEAALGEIRALGLDIPMIALAKEQENIYVPGREEPVSFREDTPGLNLVRRVRDEAHRFARVYHHLLHRKKVLGEK